MIGIIILNYNGWGLTIKCIESIRTTCKKNYRIYIVDNASTTEMTKTFKEFIDESDDIELLINKINKGYSAGNNVGIKRALEDNCNYFLITNNDVIFKDESIDELCNFLDNNSEYGIVGPKVFLPNGKIQEINMGCKLTLAGKYLYILRKTPLKFLSTKFVKKFHAVDQNLKEPFDVFAVSGCCFMLSSNAMKILYPMDENTFLYEEENIIGVKLEKAGLKTKYDTNSEIIHIGGESTKHLSAFAYKCFIESEVYYCRTYLDASIVQLIPLIAFRIIKYIFNYGFFNFKSLLKNR